MKKQKSLICFIAAVYLLGSAAFCIYHIFHHYNHIDEQIKEFAKIAEAVENTPDSETIPEDKPLSEGEDILAKYKELYLQNKNMVGWISIEDTTINYPV